MEREDKRGIFFGVIGVLTLIVAIIGASLAYFSINASSKKDAITVQAASLQIVYEDGNQLNVKGIIPSTKSVAMETFRRYLAKETYTADLGEGDTQVAYEKCIDDKGYTVCGVYDFSLTNNGVNSANVTVRIVPTVTVTNEEGEEVPTTETQFKNLKYALYDISSITEADDRGEYVGDATTVTEQGDITYEEFNVIDTNNAITVPGNQTTKRYRLFIWLDEQGEANNEEQGAVFRGTVYIDVAGAENITGTASGAA